MKIISSTELKARVENMSVVPNTVSVPKVFGLGLPYDIGVLGALGASFAEGLAAGFKDFHEIEGMSPVKAYGISPDHNLIELGPMNNRKELERAVRGSEDKIVAYMVHLYSAFTAQDASSKVDVSQVVAEMGGDSDKALRKLSEMGLEIKVGIISFVYDKYGMWSMAAASSGEIELLGYSDLDGDMGVDFRAFGGPNGEQSNLTDLSQSFRGMFRETLTYDPVELAALEDHANESAWHTKSSNPDVEASVREITTPKEDKVDNVLGKLKGLLDKAVDDPQVIDALAKQDGDDNWRSAYLALQALAKFDNPKEMQRFLAETPLIVRKAMRDSLMRRVELLDESMKLEIH